MAGSRHFLLTGAPDALCTFAMNAAVTVTTGRPWPNTRAGQEPGRVLMLSDANRIDDVILPRFRAERGDESRITFVKTTGHYSLPGGFPDLARIISRRGIRLAVFDNVAFYLGNSSLIESRKALTAYANLARGGAFSLVFLDRCGALTHPRLYANCLEGIAWRAWDMRWAKRWRGAPKREFDPWTATHTVQWGANKFLLRPVAIRGW